MITDRNLEQGMKLAARFKKVDYTAEVVEAERDDVSGSKDEGLRIKLADGRVFRSVSSAAKAVTGGSINGWKFWSLAGQAEPEKPQKTKPVGRGKAAQDGMTEETAAQSQAAAEPPAGPEGSKPEKKKARKAPAKAAKKSRTPKGK